VGHVNQEAKGSTKAKMPKAKPIKLNITPKNEVASIALIKQIIAKVTTRILKIAFSCIDLLRLGDGWELTPWLACAYTMKQNRVVIAQRINICVTTFGWWAFCRNLHHLSGWCWRW
jgi:transposase